MIGPAQDGRAAMVMEGRRALRAGSSTVSPQLWTTWLTLPVTAVIALFILKLAYPVDYDPDFYWHMKTGEYIVTHLALPYGDIFSYTAHGRSWVLHEWLTEVIFYGVNAAVGNTGLWAFIAGIAALTFYLLYRLAAKALGDETRAVLVTLLFYVPLLSFAAPRPQLFTYLLFTVFLYVLHEYKYAGRARLLAALPPLMLLWANLHGAFVAGFALLGLFIGGEGVKWLLTVDRDPLQKKRVLMLIGVAAACALATLANPRFIEYWKYPFEVVNMTVSTGWILEWRSPDFHDPHYKYFLGILMLFYVVCTYARRKPDLTELAVPSFFIVAGFTSIRHLPLASIATLPFFAMFLREVDFHMPAGLQSSRWSRWLTRDSTHLSARALAALNLVLLCAVAAYAWSGQQRDENEVRLERLLPVKAVDFVVANGIKGRLFNDYGHGGYLIYRLFPDQLVFIDGRADMYGDAFVNEYIAITNAMPEWKQKFEAFGIDYAILPRESPLRQLLLAERSFRLVYDDAHHSVLVRDVPRFSYLPDVSPARVGR